MATTYEPIATTTLGSAASTITFSSIPSTYTDLKLIIVPTVTSGTADAKLTFNGDTATNYSQTRLQGTGTSALSGSRANDAFIYLDRNTINQTPALESIDIFSYAGSTYKTLLQQNSEDFNGSGAVAVMVALWRSTAAITSITLTTTASTYAVGTTATLYGILKA